MKKNVLLIAYTKKNVGDDLFVSILLNRYKNTDFTIRNIEEQYDEPFKIYKNFQLARHYLTLIYFLKACQHVFLILSNILDE